MSITFAVDNVKPVEPKFHFSEKTNQQFLKQGIAAAGLRGESIEASKFNYKKFSPTAVTSNSFVATALSAFSDHSPFAIAPDDVWLLIAQAVTKHISLNPEDCRKALGVNWEDKKTLTVVNSDFVKGSPDNDWEREFSKFADLIKESLGIKADMLNPTFSTTGPTEKAAIQVQMMSALAPYLDYRMMTLCGVPSVTLLGNPEDWDSILGRVAAFGEFYPKWAHEPMIAAVGQFVKASAGLPDMEFWQNFFKRSYGSGGTRVNGWMSAFFPYMDDKPNRLMIDKEGNYKDFNTSVLRGPDAGYDVGSFPSSVGMVPMLWDYYGKGIAMGLVTGMFGSTIIEENNVKSFKTVIGWAVGESRNK